MRTMTLFVTLLATLFLAGCNAPGGSGEYATHDRGNGTIDKALRR